jgi:hypothetical protein
MFNNSQENTRGMQKNGLLFFQETFIVSVMGPVGFLPIPRHMSDKHSFYNSYNSLTMSYKQGIYNS